MVRTFSIDDAKRANLYDKRGPWVQYPARMCQMRARAFALRDVFTDVLEGLSVAEEVESYSPSHPVSPPNGDRPRVGGGHSTRLAPVGEIKTEPAKVDHSTDPAPVDHINAKPAPVDQTTTQPNEDRPPVGAFRSDELAQRLAAGKAGVPLI